jgi:nucleotide-binding universal stress UspA family protein
MVPLDGSKIAEQAFPYVTELARAFGSEVMSVGICEPEESEYSHICHVYMNNQADLLKSKIGDDTATRVKSVVLSGRPAEEILSYAEKNDISLIVMASHGRSGIKPWSLGSTVDKILHKIAAPLLIIKATEQPSEFEKTRLFNRILVPLDGSEACEVVLPYMSELMQKLKSEVVLLQVVSSCKHVHTIGGIDYIAFKDYDIESMKTRDQEYLNKVCNKLHESKNLVKKCEVRVGDPAQEIVKCANEMDCQLIMLPSHLHSGIERWAFGSVTYKILQTTNKSILLIPLPISSG